ncbi:Zf-FLZ domain [Dillenia turbinata]|uniref:Zf-FLZ domain n=1 Tax=Dillenia turbinata TaxID=194707 RepID=A0AAN8Z9Q7_9MAGN
MADNGSVSSPTEKYRRLTSSFFSSPRLFTAFSSKGFLETESVMSPTSILDSKNFSALKNPFWSDTPKSSEISNNNNSEVKRCYWEKFDSKGVGLSIVDDDKSNSEERVLFGSQLKIQIPPLFSSVLSPSNSPKNSSDFEIKTSDSQLSSFSYAQSPPSEKTGFGSVNSGLETPNSPRVFAGCLSAAEMELSEDYTCVITHGPNPTTTHIFDNCVVESCCGVVGFSDAKEENVFFGTRFPSESFLSFCYHCKKNLGHGKDIFMYRGEKAFCSHECRYQEMLMEEGMEKADADDLFGTCS